MGKTVRKVKNEIQVFNHEQFGQIRICQNEGKEWFCLSDVCKALALTTPAKVKQRLSQRGMNTIHTPVVNQYGNAYEQKMTYIDEANLYRCIFQSRKQEAEGFQNWVFETVLPQIRQTGGYVPVAAEDDESTIMAKALLVAQKTIEKKDALLEEQKPLVQFAEAVTACGDGVLIRDLAKLATQNGCPIGQNRLFGWLREKGFLFKHENRPVQRYVEMGLFVTSETVINTHHGPKERLTTRVTGKGQRYLLEKLMEDFLSNY